MDGSLGSRGEGRKLAYAIGYQVPVRIRKFLS